MIGIWFLVFIVRVSFVSDDFVNDDDDGDDDDGVDQTKEKINNENDQ